MTTSTSNAQRRQRRNWNQRRGDNESNQQTALITASQALEQHVAPIGDNLLQLLGGQRVTRDRWMAVMLKGFTDHPRLRQCDPLTIQSALLEAAGMGLEPFVGQQAWILPYWSSKRSCYEAKLIPGYQGLLSGVDRKQCPVVVARVVYSGDTFAVRYAPKQIVEHVPSWPRSGERIAVYSMVEFAGGQIDYEPLSIDEVEDVRKRSKAATDGPWVSDYDEMAKKTALRRHMKRLPKTPSGERLMALDAEAENDAYGAPPPASVKPLRGVAAVHAQLGVGQQSQEDPPPPDEHPAGQAKQVSESKSGDGERPDLVARLKTAAAAHRDVADKNATDEQRAQLVDALASIDGKAVGVLLEQAFGLKPGDDGKFKLSRSDAAALLDVYGDDSELFTVEASALAADKA